MFSTSSFNINIIRNSVDEFNFRFRGFGTATVFPTYINNDGAHGIARSESQEVIEMIQTIAERRVQEQSQRFTRQEYLRMALDAGEITSEQFDREYAFSF